MVDLRKFLSADRGALLIEAALVTPFLIITFITIAQFGFAFYVQATIQSAVRSAIRDASIASASVGPASSTNCAAEAGSGSVGDVVCGYLANTNLFAGQAAFSVQAASATYDNETTGDTSDDVDNMITVTASVPLNSVIFIDYNGLLSGGRSLTAYAVMQQEP